MMVVTVTGSTGTIGGELVQLLSQARVATRAVFRDPAKLRPLPGVVWARADLRDTALLEPLLAGTTRLFLLSDNTQGFGEHQIDVLRVAEELGVEHTVKLSALGASDHSKSPIGREHWEVEQALQRSKMSWTILRPHSFMQNWLADVAQSVRAKGLIESPIEDGRVPYIDTRDIADVSFQTLLNPEPHAGRKYVLTGAEAVGFADVAAAISDAIRQPVIYKSISMEEARARMEERGDAPWLIESTLALATYQRAGGPTARVSDAVERILHRPPRSIRDFARDHAKWFDSSL